MTRHYLLTIPLTRSNLHCYVMANDPRYVEAMLAKMVDEFVPMTGDTMVLGMVLQTELGDAAGIVRDIVMGDPPSRESLAAAKDFFFSAFSTSDLAVDRQLMELH